MPEPIVRDDLAAGRLKPLDLPEWSGGFYAMQAIHRTDTPPGPAAAWMIRRFPHRRSVSRSGAPQRRVVARAGFVQERTRWELRRLARLVAGARSHLYRTRFPYERAESWLCRRSPSDEPLPTKQRAVEQLRLNPIELQMAPIRTAIIQLLVYLAVVKEGPHTRPTTIRWWAISY
jgi:hypothetical protein